METKVILAAIGGVVAAVVAPIQGVLAVLVGLMLLDFLVALLVNGKRGAWSPEAGYLGWRRKAVTILLLMALAIAQVGLAGQTGYKLPAAEGIGGGLCILELVSIGRNSLLAGVWLPRILRLAFAKLEKEIMGNPETDREPVAHG